MSTAKTIVHTSASTVQVHTASASQTVAVTPLALGERVWISTNPLVSVYPWLGQSVTVGTTTSFGVSPGQTLYSYTNQPATLAVTIT